MDGWSAVAQLVGDLSLSGKTPGLNPVLSRVKYK